MKEVSGVMALQNGMWLNEHQFLHVIQISNYYFEFHLSWSEYILLSTRFSALWMCYRLQLFCSKSRNTLAKLVEDRWCFTKRDVTLCNTLLADCNDCSFRDFHGCTHGTQNIKRFAAGGCYTHAVLKKVAVTRLAKVGPDSTFCNNCCESFTTILTITRGVTRNCARALQDLLHDQLQCATSSLALTIASELFDWLFSKRRY